MAASTITRRPTSAAVRFLVPSKNFHRFRMSAFRKFRTSLYNERSHVLRSPLNIIQRRLNFLLLRFRRLLPLLFLFCLLCSLPGLAAPARAPKNSPVNYRRVLINGVRAYVVTVDLNCKRIALTPMSSNGRYKSFRRFIKESKPLAAINGTFFDPATATIVCNLISGGKLLSEGRVGHSLRIDKDNKAELVATAGRPGRLLSNLQDWVFGMSSGPTLLRSNQYMLYPWREGFRDPGLLGVAPRSAIGITKHNKLLLVTVRKPVRLQRLAWMMKALGAKDALNLDGGSSTALYFDGRFVTRPRRMLTNIVAVHLRPAETAKASVPVVAQPVDAPIFDAAEALPTAIWDSPKEAPLDPEYVATEEPVEEGTPAPKS